MATTEIGRAAEAAVAERLKKDGFQILARNWRTKACEIDIVAKKENIIYFVEVKYRRSDNQGGGLSHITLSKMKQMRFAAMVWAQFEDWSGDYRLLAVAVSPGGMIEDMMELE